MSSAIPLRLLALHEKPLGQLLAFASRELLSLPAYERHHARVRVIQTALGTGAVWRPDLVTVRCPLVPCGDRTHKQDGVCTLYKVSRPVVSPWGPHSRYIAGVVKEDFEGNCVLTDTVHFHEGISDIRLDDRVVVGDLGACGNPWRQLAIRSVSHCYSVSSPNDQRYEGICQDMSRRGSIVKGSLLP